MRTLSKFGLAGVRLGYMMGPKALDCRGRQGAPALQHQRAELRVRLFALEHQDVFAAQAQDIRAQRAMLLASVARHARCEGLSERCQHDSGCGCRMPRKTVFDGMKARKVLVKNVSKMHPLLANCLRLTVGTATRTRPCWPLCRNHYDQTTPPSPPLPAHCRGDAQHGRDAHHGQGQSGRHRQGQVCSTGIGFFDHMLDQIARHGLIDLDIQAEGDLHIDGHHTVEDVGIAFGQAVHKAVGDKKGIRRYGHAYVPLDEALSRVVIDLSGRPGLVMNVPFKSGMIGTFDSQLAHEFFQGFVNHAFVDAAH